MAGIEIVAGSVIHGLKIPLGGNFLSLIQILFLNLVSFRAVNFLSALKSPLYVSSIAACLKSLSPAGNKFGPMLSIWMQGFLFSIGILFFGRNFVGRSIGSFMSSIWAFLQPVLTLYLFFGNSLFSALNFYLTKLNQILPFEQDYLIVAVLTVIISKGTLSIIIATIIVPSYFEKIELKSETLIVKKKSILQGYFKNRNAEKSFTQRLKLTFKDCLQPLFIISFVLGAVFCFFYATNTTQFIWMSLRPLAIAFLFFYISRSILIVKIIDKLKKRSVFRGFFQSFDQTMEFLLKDDSIEKRP